jgi:phospholipase/carboxylesterase
MSACFDTPPVEIETATPVYASVLWLHGLGADGHDFEPLVPQLGLAPGVRFVFPHAPCRPVSLNGGMVMRAWYDIALKDRGFWQNPDHLREACALIEQLLARERARGVPSRCIVLAGFSQGGAIALHAGLRYPEPLAGILALSAPLPFAAELGRERHPANAATAVFLAHGAHDSLIPLPYIEGGRDHLAALGVPIEWHLYPMGHEVVPAEIADIAGWFRRVLPAPD